MPTLFQLVVSTGGFAFALISKTSLSGRLKRTTPFQSRPRGSRQAVPASSFWTIRPVSGPLLPAMFTRGFGMPPGTTVPSDRVPVQVGVPSQTVPSPTVVVRLPEWKMPAKTFDPSALTASARGVSPKSFTTVSGVPPSVEPRLVASKTHTSARPTPGVVSCASKPMFWPRCAVVTKAR